MKKKKHWDNISNIVSTIIMVLIVFLCAYICKHVFLNRENSIVEANSSKTADAFGNAFSAKTNIVEKRIEEIRVGDKLPGKNPDRSEVDDFFEDIPNHDNWQLLTLTMTKEDRTKVSIKLLRPKWWIETREAFKGSRIYVDMAELGVEGEASVISVEPCPVISKGVGNIVTGTFRHECAKVIDMTFEGLDHTLGCTASHPFWSVDRQAFIQASELKIGEHVSVHSGNTIRLISKKTREGELCVNNLEVYGEHVYEVTSLGILVHNKCAGLHHLWPKSWGSLIPYGNKALLNLNAEQHTLIHKKLSEYLVKITGKAFGSQSGKAWREETIKVLDGYLDDFYHAFSQTPEGIKMAEDLYQSRNSTLGLIDGHIPTIYDMFKHERAVAIGLTDKTSKTGTVTKNLLNELDPVTKY